MKGRSAPHHHLRKLPEQGLPDGSHLWRPGRWGGCDTGRVAEGTRRVGASDPEVVIWARDLITRWTLSRSLKNRKSI